MCLDAHLYFQTPGGQVFRLVGSNEDLSLYEGVTFINTWIVLVSIVDA